LEELRATATSCAVERTAGSHVSQAVTCAYQTANTRTEGERHVAPGLAEGATAGALSFCGCGSLSYTSLFLLLRTGLLLQLESLQ
jgi:hypothetical protein